MDVNQRKIVLLGSGGLLGSSFKSLLSTDPSAALISFTRQDLDITNTQESERMLQKVHPDVVINAAALCNMEACEEDPEASIRVNAEAPRWWAVECSKLDIKLVHVSTDYIFDGSASEPYGEEVQPSPLSVYAKHKAEADEAVLKFSQHLVVRVAWVFGSKGKTFMSKIPQLLMEREELNVATGRRGSCLFAPLGAQWIWKAIQEEVSGVLNCAHSEEVTWELFAGEALDKLKARGLNPACAAITPVSQSEIGTLKALRPPYTTLNLCRLSEVLGVTPPSWKVGLDAYLDLLYPSEESKRQRS